MLPHTFRTSLSTAGHLEMRRHSWPGLHNVFRSSPSVTNWQSTTRNLPTTVNIANREISRELQPLDVLIVTPMVDLLWATLIRFDHGVDSCDCDCVRLSEVSQWLRLWFQITSGFPRYFLESGLVPGCQNWRVFMIIVSLCLVSESHCTQNQHGSTEWLESLARGNPKQPSNWP